MLVQSGEGALLKSVFNCGPLVTSCTALTGVALDDGVPVVLLAYDQRSIKQMIKVVGDVPIRSGTVVEFDGLAQLGFVADKHAGGIKNKFPRAYGFTALTTARSIQRAFPTACTQVRGRGTTTDVDCVAVSSVRECVSCVR